MRNLEAGLGEHETAIEEDVEVESARAVGDGGGTIASEESLNGEKSIKEWVRREIGFKSDDGVQEARLIGEANGLGGIERGTRDDVAERANVLESCGERGIGRAGGAGKVGAEGDVGEGHALLRVAEVATFAELATHPFRRAKARQKGWGNPAKLPDA